MHEGAERNGLGIGVLARNAFGCAFFHGSDNANMQNSLPPKDGRQPAQSAAGGQRPDSPYQASRPGADAKYAVQGGQPPILNIGDKPTATERMPYAGPSTIPNVTNNLATPPFGDSKSEIKLPVSQENPVPDRPTSSSQGTGFLPEGPTTSTVPAAQNPGSRIAYNAPAAGAEPPAPEPHPTSPKEPPLIAFMRLYLEKRPGEAVAQLSPYDKTRQDLLLGLLSLATYLTEGDPSKIQPEQAAMILNKLASIAAPLRSKAPLMLSGACLCKTVKDFGQRELLPPDYIFPQGGHVEFYVEVQNFWNVPRSDGNYEVWLTSSADLCDSEGHVVPNTHIDYYKGGPEATQTSSPRRDYHRGYTMELPPSLPPGRYVIRLRVKDVPTERIATQTFALTIGRRAAGCDSGESSKRTPSP